jgi:hypothetical protein
MPQTTDVAGKVMAVGKQAAAVGIRNVAKWECCDPEMDSEEEGREGVVVVCR